MLSKKMEKALNGQINAEMYSSYMYLSMSAWFEQQGLAGLATWMNQQAQEEMFHAMKFFNFVHERGAKVLLEAIAKPPVKWKSALDVLEVTLAMSRR